MNPSFKQRVLAALAPRVGYAYIRLLRATMRLEYQNREALARARAEKGGYILAFWHARFVMMPFAYPDRRIVILSSRHRDSRLLAEIMARFGFEQAWGSSSAGGSAGLREILRRLREGYDVGITPDGPRGPRRRLQPGVVTMAKLSGRPIVPVAFSARPARRLSTWDRTLLPYPFARGLYLYGEPQRVARRADAAEEAASRLALEAELDRLTEQADAQLGVAPEEPREPVGRG